MIPVYAYLIAYFWRPIGEHRQYGLHFISVPVSTGISIYIVFRVLYLELTH